VNTPLPAYRAKPPIDRVLAGISGRLNRFAAERLSVVSDKPYREVCLLISPTAHRAAGDVAWICVRGASPSVSVPLGGTKNRRRHLLTPLAGTAIEFSACAKYGPSSPRRMAAKIRRLFMHERAAISAGLSNCSTEANDSMMSRSSARLLFLSSTSKSWRDLPARFRIILRVR
jgi:hypothetical protein